MKVSRGIFVGEPSMESGGEAVERVRNPGDGRFRMVVEATGIYGRQVLEALKGKETPGEVHPHCACGCGCRAERLRGDG
jgi:hypothetical protein